MFVLDGTVTETVTKPGFCFYSWTDTSSLEKSKPWLAGGEVGRKGKDGGEEMEERRKS